MSQQDYLCKAIEYYLRDEAERHGTPQGNMPGGQYIFYCFERFRRNLNLFDHNDECIVVFNTFQFENVEFLEMCLQIRFGPARQLAEDFNLVEVYKDRLEQISHSRDDGGKMVHSLGTVLFCLNRPQNLKLYTIL